MSILITVNIDADPDTVQKVEDANPEVMQEISTAARKYMTGHRRTVREGHVMDIDEFASEADYNAFIGEAGEVIERYGKLIGVAPRDTIWTVVE